jgi:hypothetical protein|tara:strand:+ start:331 stop:540 length:210 start_codon:yes stop_codon:yes gene_type:complete
MSLQYKINNFSTEQLSTSTDNNNINKTTKPNIDHLLRRILVERRRERKKLIASGIVFFSIVLIFSNFFL